MDQSEFKINEENFAGIDPSVLLAPENYRQVEDMIVSIDAANTPDYARSYAVLLADKLSAVGERMPKDLFAGYARLLKVLKLGALPDASDAEKGRFFKEDILDVLWFDFIDIRREVDSIFREYYDDAQILHQLRKIFMDGLEHNIENLGNADLTVAGESARLRPTIRNWLIDYNRSAPLANFRNTRGRLEENSFISRSMNAQKLDRQQKGVLLRILSLYDWLRFNQFEYNFSLPEQSKPVSEMTNEVEIEGDSHPLFPDDVLAKLNQDRELRRIPISPYMSANAIPKASVLRTPVPGAVSRPAAPRPPRVMPPAPPPPVVQPLRPTPPPVNRPPTPAPIQTQPLPPPLPVPVPFPPRPVLPQKPLTPSPDIRVSSSAPIPPTAPVGLPAADVPRATVSVNEALVHAGSDLPSDADRSVIGPGEKDIDQKLKDLQDRAQ